jgi:hypothetical protein
LILSRRAGLPASVDERGGTELNMNSRVTFKLDRGKHRHRLPVVSKMNDTMSKIDSLLNNLKSIKMPTSHTTFPLRDIIDKKERINDNDSDTDTTLPPSLHTTPSPTPSSNTPIPSVASRGKQRQRESSSSSSSSSSLSLISSQPSPRLTHSQVVDDNDRYHRRQHRQHRHDQMTMSRGNTPGSRFIPQIPLMPPSKTLRHQRDHGVQNSTAPWRGTNIEKRNSLASSSSLNLSPTFFHLRIPHETNLIGSNFSKRAPDETKIISVPTDVDWVWFIKNVSSICGMKQHVVFNDTTNGCIDSRIHIQVHATNEDITSMIDLRSLVPGTILNVSWYDRHDTNHFSIKNNGVHGNVSVRELPKFDPDSLPCYVQIVKATIVPSRERFEQTNNEYGGTINGSGSSSSSSDSSSRSIGNTSGLPKQKAHIMEIIPTWSWSNFIQAALYLLESKEECNKSNNNNEQTLLIHDNNDTSSMTSSIQTTKYNSTKDIKYLDHLVVTTFVYNGAERVRSMREMASLEGGAVLTIHINQGERNTKITNASTQKDLNEISRFIIGSDLAFELEMAASAGQHLHQNNMKQLTNGLKTTNDANVDTMNETSALVPYVNEVLLRNHTITQVFWKHLWISFIISPPGGEAFELCKELQRKRGYIHISFEEAVAKEIQIKSDLGLEILHTLSSGRAIDNGGGGMSCDLATRVLRKAIYLSAIDRSQAMIQPSLEDSPLTIYMTKEKSKHTTSSKSSSKGREGPYQVYRKILSMRFIIDGFPMSLQHCQHFEKSTTIGRYMYYISLTEENSIKCLLSTLNTPMFDVHGNPTTNNHGGHAGYRRKLHARKKVENFFTTIAPVLHYYATTGGNSNENNIGSNCNRLIRLDKSQIMKLKKDSQRRILAVDPELYDEVSRTLTPQPIIETLNRQGGGEIKKRATAQHQRPTFQQNKSTVSPRTKQFLRRTKHEQRAREYRNVPIQQGGGNNGDLTMKNINHSKRNEYINNSGKRSSKRVDALENQDRPNFLEQVADGIVQINDDNTNSTKKINREIKKKQRIHSENIKRDERRTGDRVILDTSDQVNLKLMLWLRSLNVW